MKDQECMFRECIRKSLKLPTG